MKLLVIFLLHVDKMLRFTPALNSQVPIYTPGLRSEMMVMMMMMIIIIIII